jgi:hypothetical protein
VLGLRRRGHLAGNDDARLGRCLLLGGLLLLELLLLVKDQALLPGPVVHVPKLFHVKLLPLLFIITFSIHSHGNRLRTQIQIPLPHICFH